ncbi:MAG: hypothetical protein AAF430_10890 [Myxococcota bacterium]
MLRTLRIAGRTYQIAPAAEAGDHAPLEPAAAERILRRCQWEPSAMRQLVTLDGGGYARRDNADVIRRISARVQRGALRMWPVEARPVPQEPTRAAPPPEESDTEEAAPPQRHWVTFRVVDDGTGEAVPGAQVKVVLPRESHARSFPTVAGSGEAHVADLNSGSCGLEDVILGGPYELVAIDG